jgi:ParB-like chromosome segregation protein Spo0J
MEREKPQMGIIFDKKYQTMPDMPPVQFQALKQDIEERGLFTPIDIDEEGHILDGHQRYQAMVELGITDFPTIVRPGMSEEEKRLYSRKTNMMRRHLGAKQIRQLIRAQILETPQWANNRIAQELGVDSKTVKTQRTQLETTSEIPKLTEFEGAD